MLVFNSNLTFNGDFFLIFIQFLLFVSFYHRDKRNIRYRALGNTGRVLMMKGKHNQALDM